MTNTMATTNNLSQLEWKRFERIGAWAVLLGVFTTLFGLSWDVSWHGNIGVDTFWTVPHLFVYSGAALTGAASLTVVLLCTIASKEVRKAGWIPVFGYFYAPIGFIIAGFGAFGFLLFGLFDQWWHVIFGFDVLLGSPPHLGLILSDILSLFGCALIFVRGPKTQTIGISLATAFALAFTIPFMLAIFSDFNLQIIGVMLPAVLIPIGMLFVISSTRQPYTALLVGLAMIAFRLFSEFIFPIITLAYANSLGLNLRDQANNSAGLPEFIPLFIPIAGLIIAIIMFLWKTNKLPLTTGLLLSGAVAAPILYLDSGRLSAAVQDMGIPIFIALAAVGAFSAWLGWQLGVVARNANNELKETT
jgi:hypothetical protein